MAEQRKTYESKLVAAYKEGHYGECLSAIINTRTISQTLADSVRFYFLKNRITK